MPFNDKDNLSLNTIFILMSKVFSMKRGFFYELYFLKQIKCKKQKIFLYFMSEY